MNLENSISNIKNLASELELKINKIHSDLENIQQLADELKSKIQNLDAAKAKLPTYKFKVGVKRLSLKNLDVKLSKQSKDYVESLDQTTSVKIKPRRSGMFQSSLPEESIQILKSWLNQNKQNPYPNEQQRVSLAAQTNLSLNQVNNWFLNARRRILPRLIQNSI